MSIAEIKKLKVDNSIDSKQHEKLKTYIVVSADSPRLSGRVLKKKIDHERTPEQIMIHDLIALQEEMLDVIKTSNKLSINCSNCFNKSKFRNCFKCFKFKSKIKVKAKATVPAEVVSKAI